MTKLLVKNFKKIILLLSIFLFNPSLFSIEKQENISSEERVWMEKFFRYFLFHENAIYTLLGSKPVTAFPLVYYDQTEEQMREAEKENLTYFLLNKNSQTDLDFYKKLNSDEKKKAELINDRDFIYNFNELWAKWNEIKDRFPLKKRYLLLEKEVQWKERNPHCIKISEIFFVDVLKTALVMQENYELFKQIVGSDFDPLQLVLDLESGQSAFWNKLLAEDGYQYAYLWGILLGYGKENAFAYFWKGRHMKMACTEKERVFAKSFEKHSHSIKRPSRTEKSAFSISNFSLPAFASFCENDPIIIRYKKEKKQIERLYKGKDFLNFTLELLMEPKT